MMTAERSIWLRKASATSVACLSFSVSERGTTGVWLTVMPTVASGLTERCRRYIDCIRSQYVSEPIEQPPSVLPPRLVK